MIVQILPDAEADLEAIGDYLARDNPRRALSFVHELRDKCRRLVDVYLAFPIVPRYEDLGVRHQVHGGHQIFYRVVGEPPERIDVIHVLHSTHNYSATLFP
ncbi:plasmid stabilization system [Burkholderia sp. H160]|nr:plasmid stabilization system [Burkholderia sp. H160]